jgi:hypothetical protein
MCVFWKEERRLCVKMCSWGWSHEFVDQDIRAWFAKVTNAKGLKCVCWLCGAGACFLRLWFWQKE